MMSETDFMNGFVTEYFVGCLWLAGMYAVAIWRFERGRALLIFAAMPLVLITAAVGVALASPVGAAEGAFIIFILFLVICIIAGVSCLIGAMFSADTEQRRHLAIATLMLGGPVLLFPVTVVFRAL